MQQRQSTLATFWRFLRPEPEELIFYFLILVVMIGLAAYRVAVQGQIGSDSQDLIASFGNARESLFAYLNAHDGLGRVFLFGLWFFIGTLTYIVAWALVTMLIDLSNDIRVSSSFVHPKSFHQSEYWLSIASRIILRVASGLALIFYGAFWVVGFAPVWMHSFQTLFGRGVSQSHIIDFLAALLGVALTLHLAAILLRLVLLRAHYSYEDR